ncbi:MAG: GFA family protein [Pseudomonadota bacterium]
MAQYTGRCYCGAQRVSATTAQLAVAYCLCSDCRRLSGAPVAAFAAFAKDSVSIRPAQMPAATVTEGVTRWFCPKCGTQLGAAFDYLPGQIYVPLGILDQIADLTPERHCHFDARLSWLALNDDLPKMNGSGRDALNNGSKPESDR